MTDQETRDENVILLENGPSTVQPKSENLNVDQILTQFVGACGIWQWGITVMAVLATPAMATFPVFVNAVPEYRCKMESRVENMFQQYNITFSQAKMIIGPSETEVGKVKSGCSRFHLDWMNQTLVKDLILNQTWANYSGRLEIPREPCPQGFVYQAKKFQYPGSIVAEFDLICDNNWLAPMGTSLFMLGMLIGFITGGWSGDKFGRRKAALGFSVIELFISVGVSLAPNHHVYHLMRTLIGVTNTGKASVLRILPMELTLAKYRSYFTSFTIIGVLFAHRAIMAGVAYLVPNWRYLNAILTIPCFGSLLFFCFLPESPRWLCSQSRPKEALQILRNACYVNHFFSKDRKKLKDFDLMVAHLRLESLSPKTVSNSNEPCRESNAWKRIRTYIGRKLPSLRIMSTAIVCTLIFAIQSFSLFGLILYGRSIKDYIYLVAFINATMAIPGPVIAGITYRVFRYRRIPLLIVYAVSLVSLLLGGLYTVLAQPETDLILTICFNCSLMMCTAAMIMCLIYIAELFPSNARTTAVGISSGFGRVGSMISTFVNQLETYTIHGIPILIYAGAMFIQLILIGLLKDTSGENLPDTNAEMNRQTKSNNTEKDALDSRIVPIDADLGNSTLQMAS